MKIDWNMIRNDFKSELGSTLAKMDHDNIVFWFKEKVERNDKFKALRIKEQYDYIRSLENDSIREENRKKLLIKSAQEVLNKIIHS